MKKALILFLFTFVNTTQAQQVFQKKLLLMGSDFGITVVCQNDSIAQLRIQDAITEIKRIEKLISSWDSTSETSRINANAGIKPVVVSEELFNLISRAKLISKLTDGAFDISYASMDKIWKFDGSMKTFPSAAAIATSVSKVGYKNIIMNGQDHSVFLKLKGMRIGFGAIGKGYAADTAKKLLQSKGVKAGIINASGDMNTWGKQPNGKYWEVAITNPMNKHKAFAVLPLKRGAIVTSGNYEKYVVFNGKRYSHIIDPRTGVPASGIISASVFASSAELADALATSLFVMGVETGLNRINQLKNTACILIDDQGKIHTSNTIKLKTNGQ